MNVSFRVFVKSIYLPSGPVRQKQSVPYRPVMLRIATPNNPSHPVTSRAANYFLHHINRPFSPSYSFQSSTSIKSSVRSSSDTINNITPCIYRTLKKPQSGRCLCGSLPFSSIRVFGPRPIFCGLLIVLFDLGFSAWTSYSRKATESALRLTELVHHSNLTKCKNPLSTDELRTTTD